jgi:hypothetical protein
MADMYTPEEINEIFAAYNDAIAKGIPVSKELAQQMKDATLGVKNYTQQLNQSLKQLGTSFKNLGAGMLKGEKGAQVYNDALSSGADAVANYASKFGPAGQAIGLLTKATMAYVGAVNKQADALYKSYKDISRAGVIGAGGMKEVYANMQKFGYGIEELGEFQSLMKANSTTLANFGGTAFNGATQFANMIDVLERGGVVDGLLKMGVSVDEINQGAAGFLKQQTMLGRNSTSMQGTLAVETAKYLENLEAVSRLTGQSREQLQQKQQDALAEQQFAAKQYELKQRALAGDEQAAKELRKLEFLNENLSGEQRMNVIRSFAGDVAASGNLMTAMPGVFAMLSDSTKDEADVIAEMAKSSKRNITDMNSAYQLGFGQDTFGKFTENAELVAKYGGMNAEEIRALIESAKKNRTAQDESTKTQVEIEKAQRKTRDNLQDFVNLGINPVTKAMRVLAGAIEFLTSFIPGAGRIKKGIESGAPTTTSGGGVEGVAVSGEVDLSGTGIGSTDDGGGKKGAAGLKLKSAEAISGGGSSDALYELAHNIQATLGGDLKYFSGLNDSRSKDGKSKHGTGQALDIVLNDPEKYGSALSTIKAMAGVSLAQFERSGQKNANGSISSGDHIHAEVSAANGAILSGPRSGYQPNLTMHGTEAVVPLPDGRSIPVSNSGESMGIMTAQLEKLEELVNVMKSQLSVSNKLLQYSS